VRTFSRPWPIEWEVRARSWSAPRCFDMEFLILRTSLSSIGQREPEKRGGLIVNTNYIPSTPAPIEILASHVS
jgi:hypothetical protein